VKFAFVVACPLLAVAIDWGNSQFQAGEIGDSDASYGDEHSITNTLLLASCIAPWRDYGLGIGSGL